MMILISGGNGSGKSAYAEKLASTMSVPRYYIATMVSQSEENERRIEKHRRQRSGLGFVTIEEPCRVSRAVIEPASLVLLEDASNLLGNMIFAEHGTKEDALQEILELQKKCRQLLVVTISGLPPYMPKVLLANLARSNLSNSASPVRLSPVRLIFCILSTR